MLHFNKTQDSKPTIIDKYGNSIIDFFIKDVKVQGANTLLTILNYFRVTEDTAMRADLITQKMYGFMDNVEGVLKMNEICNPFAIDSNEVLYVYDLPSLENNMRQANLSASVGQDVRNQYITPEKGSKADPNLSVFDKRNTATSGNPSKGGQPALPPNYASFGDKEIQIVGGKVVFGANVTKQTQNCDQPLSKSDFIARLIKNRLNQ